MTTPAVVREAIVTGLLFGFSVKTITIEGVKYFTVTSIFDHFNAYPSVSFKRDYCKKFPALREYCITYGSLRAYCMDAMGKRRLKTKSELMALIAKYVEPADQIPSKPIGAGAVDIPDTATVEGQTAKALIENLGPTRLIKLLNDLGLKLPPSVLDPSTKERVIKLELKITY